MSAYRPYSNPGERLGEDVSTEMATCSLFGNTPMHDQWRNLERKTREGVPIDTEFVDRTLVVALAKHSIEDSLWRKLDGDQ
jgi:hypothetical protein